MPVAQSATSDSLKQGIEEEVPSNIVIELDSPKGFLFIEKIGKGCFKLYFSDTKEKMDFRHIDDIRRPALEKAMPFIPFFRAVIVSRKIGTLRLVSSFETRRLNNWLKMHKVK